MKSELVVMSASELTTLLTEAVSKAIQANVPLLLNPTPTPTDRIGGIELALEITGKAQSTIYNLVSAGKIPHGKQGKKLYFSEQALKDWIQQGGRKTTQQIHSQNEQFLATRRIRRNKTSYEA